MIWSPEDGRYRFYGNEGPQEGYRSLLCIVSRNRHSLIKLSANNLLDQKAYSYTVFNGLNIHSYDFALRPREVVLSILFTM